MKRDYLEIEQLPNKGEQASDAMEIVQLQLSMATSSINHEYARIEYEDTLDRERKEQLLDYMGACREKYFEARDALEEQDPRSLCDFESELLTQKRDSLQTYNA